jgi:hypothetical protein
MMLDELREEAGAGYYDEEEVEEGDFDEAPSYFRTRYGSGQPFLGMTPVQRFVVALMLLLMTCILGTSILLLTEIVIPPFL